MKLAFWTYKILQKPATFVLVQEGTKHCGAKKHIFFTLHCRNFRFLTNFFLDLGERTSCRHTRSCMIDPQAGLPWGFLLRKRCVQKVYGCVSALGRVVTATKEVWSAGVHRSLAHLWTMRGGGVKMCEFVSFDFNFDVVCSWVSPFGS